MFLKPKPPSGHGKGGRRGRERRGVQREGVGVDGNGRGGKRRRQGEGRACIL